MTKKQFDAVQKASYSELESHYRKHFEMQERNLHSF